MEIRDKFKTSIEATGNPLAPIILTEAYNSVIALGKMMASHAKPEIVEGIKSTLLSGWTDEQIDLLNSSPDFIITLASMLVSSLENYVGNLKHDS